MRPIVRGCARTSTCARSCAARQNLRCDESVRRRAWSSLQMALQTSDDASDRGLQQALRHERALRRLAASLLRDPGSADDAVEHALVQEALQRRRPGVPLLPFLRAVLRRYASNVRTLAQRHARRETAAARPEAVPSAEEIAAREQLRR